MNTIHCAASPLPATATTAVAAAAMATGPRKKPSVRISPTAITPAAIIHKTHSSMSTGSQGSGWSVSAGRAGASAPIELERQRRSSACASCRGPRSGELSRPRARLE